MTTLAQTLRSTRLRATYCDFRPQKISIPFQTKLAVTAASHLSTSSFQSKGDSIYFNIEHRYWPLREGHAGYYILLLPPGYGGSVKTSDGYENVIFLRDSRQLLLSATVYPDRALLSLSGRLEKRSPPPAGAEQRTTAEVFRSTLPGVHYTPVDNLLKALRQNLSEAASAFLCHSSADKEKARRLAIDFATRGVRPWIDEAEIRTGDSLIDKIQSGIQSSTCLVPILSKASVGSRWCKEELRMALAMQIKSGIKSVLPVLVDDCEIPGFLMEKAYADLRDWRSYDERVDRLAADIRELKRPN